MSSRPDLGVLLDPRRTVLVTQECQNGAVGPDAMWPALAEAAAPALGRVVDLVTAARTAGAHVVHCVVGKRADLRGSNRNAPLFRAATRPGRLELGTAAAELVEPLAGDPRDVVLTRAHGVSPMYRTGLDPLLRNLGATTVVVCGVSVNVAVWSLCLDAVNAGYRVVVPRDAVAGVPSDYAARVVENSLSLLADVVDSRAIVSTWGSAT